MIHRAPRKNRNAFRPCLEGSPLEVRLVLSTATGGTIHAMATSLTPPPAAPPFSPAVTVATVRQAFLQQNRALSTQLRQELNSQITTLFANGRPSQQQLTNFNAAVMGIANAAALRSSSQAALLPNSASRLVRSFQNTFLGAQTNSLINRVQSLAASGRTSATAAALQAAVGRQLNTTLASTNNQLANFFASGALTRGSVNSAGQPIPIQLFMSNRLMNQVGNTLGLLSQTFSGVANSTLFPNGTTDANGQPIIPSQAAISAFNRQAGTALQTAAFQLNSGLSVFPGAARATAALSPILFGTGTGNNLTSLSTTLQNLQFGGSTFNNDVTTAFNNSLGNIFNAVNPLVGTPATSQANLASNGFTSVFGSNFNGNNFANGFNNGFVTGQTNGFFGFGTAPTSFNNNFSTGFNSLINRIDSIPGVATTN